MSLPSPPPAAPAGEASQSDSPSLTPAQQRIVQWLLEREASGLPPPSLDQICAGLGLRSRGSLHKHIQALVAKGLVEPIAGLRRGVRVRAGQSASPGSGEARVKHIPLLGRIAAGQPIAAVPVPGLVQVPVRLLGHGEHYVLEVAGDSMADAGICDGDWVVVEHRQHAHDGEVVVALVDEDAATLKRIEQRPDACVLWPANANHGPQVYAPERVRIQGVLTGMMRRW